jgi:hypothetical protein
VRRRRQRRPRRAAQHVAVVAALEQEAEVRPAGNADPLGAQRPGAEPVLVEKRLDTVEDDER